MNEQDESVQPKPTEQPEGTEGQQEGGQEETVAGDETPNTEDKAEPAPSRPPILRDPNTGEPLRDQNPGVPNGPWVGKHNSHDMDDAPLEKDKDIKGDFGDSEDEEEA